MPGVDAAAGRRDWTRQKSRENGGIWGESLLATEVAGPGALVGRTRWSIQVVRAPWVHASRDAKRMGQAAVRRARDGLCVEPRIHSGEEGRVTHGLVGAWGMGLRL